MIDNSMLTFRAKLIKQSEIEGQKYLKPYCVKCGTQHVNSKLYFTCLKCKHENSPPDNRLWKMELI